jgi:hypothetical protein
MGAWRRSSKEWEDQVVREIEKLLREASTASLSPPN